MKLLLIVGAALVLGGLLGTLLARDAGYVLVSYGDTAVETSLWVAVLLFATLYFLIRGTVYLVGRTARGQATIARWRSGRRSRSARSRTIRGLLMMMEGRWAEASQLLVSSAGEAETPLINYLTAARAAHELGQNEDRDRYLKLAHESTPGAKFAVTLTQAEFNISEGAYEQALAALLMLRKRAPKHQAVLSMLAQCYERLEDWQALAEIFSDLTRLEVIPENEQRRLQKTVWRALLTTETPIAEQWKKLPRGLKGDASLIYHWVTYLLDRDRADDAEQVVRWGLDQTWDEQLVVVYGEVESSDTAKQLVVAQNWLKDRAQDAALNLTVGRLCLMNEKFEQAREYFEASLRLQPTDAVYGELGRLCVALGDERRGTEYLLNSLGGLRSLPQPSEPRIRKASVT